jgi:TRAP transporter TAXI family solute receptor
MKKVTFCCFLAITFCLGPYALTGSFSADLPRIVTMGTMPAGMLVNIQGAGIADVISKHTPMDLKIQAVTSEEVWVPMMLTDEVDIGVAVSLTMRNAFKGVAVYEDIANKVGVKGFPIRLVTIGTPIRMSILVPGSSDAKTTADLKGKTITSFAPQTAFDMYSKALLANGGLEPGDYKEFPVANPAESARAVLEGNADAGMVAAGAPVVAEAVARVDARWVHLVTSPEAEKRMQEVIPTSYIDNIPGGVFVGAPEAQPMLHLDVYLVARENLSEDAVYEMTKILFEKNDELTKKPMLKEWIPSRFLSKRAYVPYHSGAIKFYKEKGLWNEEMEAMQNDLIAEAP